MLKHLIREMINEMDRFEKETGRQFNVLYDREGTNLFEMAQEEIAPGVPRYYFNMSKDFKMTVHGGERIGQIKKVSTISKPAFVRAMVPGKEQNVQPSAIANPKAEYNTTPIGFYAYPLNREYLQLLMDDTLPYFSHGEWCTVIEAKPGIGILNLGNEEDANLYAGLKRLIITAGRKSDTVIKDALLSGSRWQNIFAKALMGSEDYIDDRESRSQKEINYIIKIMRQKKIRLVYDPGTGLVYDAEPDQAVFLSSGAFDVVERFPTAELRKSLKSAYPDMGTADQKLKPEWQSPKNNLFLIMKNETDPGAIRNALSMIDIDSMTDSNKSKYGSLLAVLSANPSTPSDVLSDIFGLWGSWGDTDYKILENIAGHKNSSVDLLEQVSWYVTYYQDIKRRHSEIVLAKNPNIDQKIIGRILFSMSKRAGEPDPELIDAIMTNPSMSEKIINDLVDTGRPSDDDTSISSPSQVEFFRRLQKMWKERSGLGSFLLPGYGNNEAEDI